MSSELVHQTILQAPTEDELTQSLRTRLEDVAPRRILFVCGRHTTDAELAMWAGRFPFTRFTGFSPNPKADEVWEGVNAYLADDCDFIIAVGGGSSIDVAKGIKWYLNEEHPDIPLPKLWALPTTAGTGSESTPFAVIYVDGIKQSLDASFLLPEIAFLSGQLILSVPAYQRNAAFMDALCQAIESMWSKAATDDSRDFSAKAIELLLLFGADYVVEGANEEDQKITGERRSPEAIAVAQQMLVASNLAGQAIGITRTTAAHAMSYGLTSRYGIAHGHAVGLCLVHVCNEHAHLAATTSGYEVLRRALDQITELFDADSPHDLAMLINGMVMYLGLAAPKISVEDAEELASGVNLQRLENNPVQFTSERMARFYNEIARGRKIFHLSDNSLRWQGSQRRIGKWAVNHKKNWKETATIQEYSIMILRDIDKVCAELGIDYFLCEGALLGAVRHQEPIPWDDDIDIAFLRADYNRFLKEAPALFGSKYAIDTYETNSRHWTISGKVQLTEKTDYIRFQTEGLSLANGPFVDLFVFDQSPKSEGIALMIRGRYISALRALLFHRTGFQKTPARRKPKTKRVLSLFTSTKWLHRRIDKACRIYENRNYEYVTNFGSIYKARKETFHICDVVPARRVPFGDMQALVPNNPTALLDKTYANFRVMPAYVKRLGKHGFIHRDSFNEVMSKLLKKED